MNTRTLLSTLIATMAFLPAQAQTLLGGKVGANYTIYSASEGDQVPSGVEVDTESLSGVGFHAGLYFQYNFSEGFGIRPEALFSMRPAKRTIDETTDYEVDGDVVGTTTDDGETKVSNSMIEIPVLLAFALGDHFHLHVGPGIGILMGRSYSSNYTTTVHVDGVDDVVTETDLEVSGSDAKKNTRTTEVAACLGAVYDLEGGLSFGVRAWKGFTPAEEDTDMTKTKSTVFQLSIGWNFMDER